MYVYMFALRNLQADYFITDFNTIDKISNITGAIIISRIALDLLTVDW